MAVSAANHIFYFIPIYFSLSSLSAFINVIIFCFMLSVSVPEYSYFSTYIQTLIGTLVACSSVQDFFGIPCLVRILYNSDGQ